MRKLVAVVALSASALLVTATPALPSDRQRALTGYSMNSWRWDRVPYGPVRALAQDTEGYLWIGTETGLVRFDGVRFVTADAAGVSGLPASSVFALRVSRADGALWVGLADGVRVIRGGRVDAPAAHQTLRGPVTALAEDVDGAMWAATSRGLFRFQAGGWRRVVVPSTRDQPISAVHIGPTGKLWVGTDAGLFERSTDGGFRRVGTSTAAVRGISEDAQGHPWVTDQVSGFRRGDVQRDATPGLDGRGVFVFHNGRSDLWVATGGAGLWRVPLTTGQASIVETSTAETGLLSNGVWSVLEDRDRNIWVGTHEGLHRFTPHDVTPLLLPLIQTIEASSDGSVWVGTARGILKLDGRNPTAAAVRRQLSTVDTRTVYRDRAGVLWVATDDGVYRLVGERLVRVPSESHDALRQVGSITGGADGVVWVADRAEGLFRWDGAALRPVAVPIVDRAISRIHGSRHGDVWIGFDGGRLARISADGRFEAFGAAHGIPDRSHTTIDAIVDDRDGSVWIGGDGGLTRFAGGRFGTVVMDPIANRRILDIVEDDRGYLWLAIERFRILRLQPAEFDKALKTRGYRIRYAEFGYSRGVPGVPVQSTRRGAVRGPDGRLFFATGHGIAVIDPHAIDAGGPPGPPAPRIDNVVADDERLAPVAGASVPAGTSRLGIDYAAVQLTASVPLRVRYRLEGFDAALRDGGSREQAVYTNLPPRAYRFVVQAESADGRTDTATWDFTIEPMFYQTYTFFALMAVGLALTGWGAWRLRVRQVRRELALVFSERMRLSREMHDTVLQDLASIAVQCGAVANAIEAATPAAHAHLVSVRRQVEEHIREMRRAVWDLRSPMLEIDDLAGAFHRVGQKATAGTKVQFELTVQGRPRRYGTRLENEVLRIGQEAVHNAVCHAQAARIRLDLTFGRRQLLLRVTDDGRGLDVGYRVRHAEGHLGIDGMKERAAQIGGQLKIATEITRGTSVELIVPAISHG